MSAGAWCLVSAWEPAPPHGTWSREYLGEPWENQRNTHHATTLRETEKGVLLMSGCVMFVVTCFRAL